MNDADQVYREWEAKQYAMYGNPPVRTYPKCTCPDDCALHEGVKE